MARIEMEGAIVHIAGISVWDYNSNGEESQDSGGCRVKRRAQNSTKRNLKDLD